MIQRYIGNKASIVDSIIEEIDILCEKGDYICDIFAGTMSVAVNLKLNGFNVIANDINSFSYVFGKSYILNNKIPTLNFNLLNFNPEDFIDDSKVLVSSLNINEIGYEFLKNEKNKKDYIQFITILLFLESISDNEISKSFRKNFFFDYYTENGKKSDFKSSRGSIGKRKFFSPENGKKLDSILNKIREWYKSDAIDDELYYLLISVVLVSIEKISNTQGTYHDFIRETYDSRALNTLKLLCPKFDFILSNSNNHIIGKERDSLDFIKEVPEHKVLYIDPPYNFRQYTSYYFMLNLISDYSKIDNLNKYFEKIQFVRGQNMEKDFSSTFCKNALFIPSLNQLITDAKTEWVIMSYYNGKNHKSNVNNDENIILNELNEFFNSNLFEKNSLKIKNIERTNYQSYGGHTASKINEILYIVKKNKI
jgi:adenine-specific DNA methylase